MTVVFISYASADHERAERVADALEAAELGVRMDRRAITAGRSFIDFMESALSTSDHCLLLWSRAAAASVYVTAEWEAALDRSLVEARAFLVVGRLEDHPVPALLRPRLYVELFPSLEPGLHEVLRTLFGDLRAATTANAPVAPARIEAGGGPREVEVYVTSELFDVVAPVRLELKKPVAALVEELVKWLDLPRTLAHGDRVQITFRYGLRLDGVDLNRRERAEALGVVAGDVLELLCTVTPLVPVAPEAGGLGEARYRTPEPGEIGDELRDAALEGARRKLHQRTRAAGLWRS